MTPLDGSEETSRASTVLRRFQNSNQKEALHRLAALSGALRPSIASTDRTQSAGRHSDSSFKPAA
jgi:hypothetical protein